MGKAAKKNEKPHLQSRVAFLFKAASHLSRGEQSQQTLQSPSNKGSELTDNAARVSSARPAEDAAGDVSHRASNDGAESKPTATTGGLSRFYVSHLRNISQKSVLRLPRDMKRALCKHCDAVLEPGVTASATTENASRHGRKPHANIRVIKCDSCGTPKRFPEGAQRQTRKTARSERRRPPKPGRTKKVASRELKAEA